MLPPSLFPPTPQALVGLFYAYVNAVQGASLYSAYCSDPKVYAEIAQGFLTLFLGLRVPTAYGLVLGPVTAALHMY
jgi:hypothetical protein